MNEGSISSIAKQLQESNANQELIFETLDGFNPILNSSLAKTNLADQSEFMLFMMESLDNIKSILIDSAAAFVIGDQLNDTLNSIKSIIIDSYVATAGNKMQEEENRREMIAVLTKIADSDNSPKTTSGKETKDTKSNGVIDNVVAGGVMGLFQTIGSFFSKSLSKILPASFLGIFANVGKFFASFVKFAKLIVKFAGPIGLVVSVITGLIGAIKGGIEGYAKGGIEGAFKGAIIGAIDMLIGSIVKGIAGVAAWLLNAVGLDSIASMIGPTVDKIFASIYNAIEGLVDVFSGLFTLDADKVIGGLKTVFSGMFDSIAVLGDFVFGFIKNIPGLILKALEFQFLTLPTFIADVMTNIFNGIKEFLPKLKGFIGELVDGLVADFWPWLSESFNVLLKSMMTSITKMNDTVSGVGAAVNSMFKTLLKSVLPDKNAKFGSVAWFAKSVVPKKVYEFAGINEPSDKLDKANKAGYKSWDEYKDSGWKWKANDIQSIPSNSGQTLNDSSSTVNSAPIIINQSGGNVTNTSMSTVNNTSIPFEKIVSGSGMAFTSQ